MSVSTMLIFARTSGVRQPDERARRASAPGSRCDRHQRRVPCVFCRNGADPATRTLHPLLDLLGKRIHARPWPGRHRQPAAGDTMHVRLDERIR
jgi:hypothetical protein